MWMWMTFPERGNVPKKRAMKYASSINYLWSGKVQREIKEASSWQDPHDMGPWMLCIKLIL